MANIGALFSWKTTATPVGWSIGHCPFCDQPLPLRHENETRSFCFALIPLTTKLVRRFMRCDFCQRPFEGRTRLEPLALAQWSPALGVTQLAAQLGIGDRADVANQPGENAIRSLLKAADERSSWEALDVGSGLVGGGVCGLVGGITFAIAGLQMGFRLGEIDEVGTAICIPLVTTVGCAIAAALLQAVWHRRRVPQHVLQRSVREYSVDTWQLQQLAEDYSRRTRNAAFRL